MGKQFKKAKERLKMDKTGKKRIREDEFLKETSTGNGSKYGTKKPKYRLGFQQNRRLYNVQWFDTANTEKEGSLRAKGKRKEVERRLSIETFAGNGVDVGEDQAYRLSLAAYLFTGSD